MSCTSVQSKRDTADCAVAASTQRWRMDSRGLNAQIWNQSSWLIAVERSTFSTSAPICLDPALSVKHLEHDDHELRIGDEGVVRGRIKWDDTHDGRLPLLIIDSREVTWDQFGHMLMSFEGWQKLAIADKSEEL